MIALLGWAVAALLAGLWWGERQRRIDAQVAAGQATRRAGWWIPRKATVVAPETPGRSQPMFTDDERERMIEDTMRELRVDRDVAERDVDDQIAQAAALGMGPG